VTRARVAVSTAAVALALAGAFASPAFADKPKGAKNSPAHEAAVQRCTDAYEATVAAAHAPNSPTGKARMRTMHAAAEAKKACIARAPK
jgi:hypothetical protein